MCHSRMLLSGIQRLYNQCLLDSCFRGNDDFAVDCAVDLGVSRLKLANKGISPYNFGTLGMGRFFRLYPRNCMADD